MQHLDISYYNDLTAQNFDYSTDIDTDHIGGVLNAMVGLLRLIGYSDGLIADQIGDLYFDDNYDPDECCLTSQDIGRHE